MKRAFIAGMTGQDGFVDDFALATGKLDAVRQFVEKAFAVVGLNWRDYVNFNEALVISVERRVKSGMDKRT